MRLVPESTIVVPALPVACRLASLLLFSCLFLQAGRALGYLAKPLNQEFGIRALDPCVTTEDVGEVTLEIGQGVVRPRRARPGLALDRARRRRAAGAEQFRSSRIEVDVLVDRA